MSSADVQPVPAAVPKAPKAPKAPKVPKAPKAPKAPGAKKVATHPPFNVLIESAIVALKERSGSSLVAIKKWFAGTHFIAQTHHSSPCSDNTTLAPRVQTSLTAQSNRLFPRPSSTDNHGKNLAANWEKVLLLQLKRLTDAGKLVKVKGSWKISAALKKEAVKKVKAVKKVTILC
jgi:histone H1/5